MARSFSGITDAINVGTSSVLNPASFSISAWVYAIGYPHSYQVVIDQQNAGGTLYWGLFVSNAGVPNVFCSISNAAGGSISLNTWTHLGVSFNNGGSLIIYINGSQVDSVGATAQASFTGTCSIGYNITGSNDPWHGYIADAALWSTPLGPSEFVGLSQGARPNTVRSGSLVGYWPLDGLSSPEPDYSGNAFEGTLTGTVYATNPPLMMATPRAPQYTLQGVTTVLSPVARSLVFM